MLAGGSAEAVEGPAPPGRDTGGQGRWGEARDSPWGGGGRFWIWGSTLPAPPLASRGHQGLEMRSRDPLRATHDYN